MKKTEEIRQRKERASIVKSDRFFDQPMFADVGSSSDESEDDDDVGDKEEDDFESTESLEDDSDDSDVVSSSKEEIQEVPLPSALTEKSKRHEKRLVRLEMERKKKVKAEKERRKFAASFEVGNSAPSSQAMKLVGLKKSREAQNEEDEEEIIRKAPSERRRPRRPHHARRRKESIGESTER